MDPGILFIILFVAIGCCIIALFASGAFMSISDQNYQTAKMKTVHNIALVLAIIVIGATLYLL
jgi:flagellar basal body-associated protein FliL